MNDKSKPIRSWTVESHPEAVDYIRFAHPIDGAKWPDKVEVCPAGVAVFNGFNSRVSTAPTDVVLAAIFRQAGIVDDLRAVLDAAAQGDGVLDNAAERIRKAFGEALS